MKIFGKKNTQEIRDEEEENSKLKLQRTKEGIILEVFEALQDDIYKGISRIDERVMRELEVKIGDPIIIKGIRKTVAIAEKAYSADVGEGIIRIDSILRKNAGVEVGSTVSISKADIKPAKKITIAPAQKNIMVQAKSDGLKKSLFGRVLMKGDLLVLGGVKRKGDLFSEDMGDFNDLFNDMFGNMGMGNLGEGVSQIKFIVVNITPENQPVIIDEKTEVVLNPKAIEIPIKEISKIGEKIPENKIILLKKLPSNIKEYYEVKNISEILKLYNKNNNFPVNKYEDDEKRVIMIGNYYYSESKKEKIIK